MNQNLLINQATFKAQIIGAILIIIGVSIIIIEPSSLNIKIGFATAIIGTFMLIMISEKSITKKTSDIQIEGNMETIKGIIKELNLKGNAIFIPSSNGYKEERILIPPNRTGLIKIPNNLQNNIFLKGENGENLGISVPPSGLKLLNEIEKTEKFQNIRIEDLNEKLQLFVSMNLLKSVSFKKKENGWNLEVEKLTSSKNGDEIINQYPEPTYSALLTAITRALNTKIRIYSVTKFDKKIIFNLNIMKRRPNLES
jgi:hypothetical protein